jgi:hypothetical protein
MKLRLREIAHVWFPLAVSFEMMMVEGPLVQGGLGRLPDPTVHLASVGLVMAISLIIESPVIMLLATAIALVHGKQSYLALQKFVVRLMVGCTVVTALVAFTPLFDFITRRMMQQPPAIVESARHGVQIMLLWTAAIGWRRFYQGILVSRQHTRWVSFGTFLRMATTITSLVVLVSWGRMSGTAVAATTLMLAVVVEAVVVNAFARRTVHHDLLSHDENAELSQRDIWKLHLPLAATTLLTLLTLPMNAAALARLPMPKDLLAAWPVVSMVLLVIRGWGLAIQEISVAMASKPDMRPALIRFAWIVGWVTTIAAIIVATTPILDVYMRSAIKLPARHWHDVRSGILAGSLLPLLTALGSYARGVLVAGHRSREVYRGMAINLAANGVALIVGVAVGLPGMWIAAGGLTIAAAVELVYLMAMTKEAGFENATTSIEATVA